MGAVLNVALYALLRFKMLLALNPDALAPGPLMVTMGLVSLVFAAFMLYRRRDIKRMFAYSSIEHMGIITFRSSRPRTVIAAEHPSQLSLRGSDAQHCEDRSGADP
jgi:NADH:ubiquinone oxidoreductase subunit 4 (subunit M)